MREPNFVVGENKEKPYLSRWWILPKNRFFNIYVHKITRNDIDRALHDHPYANMSFILKGSYTEVVPDFSGAPTRYVRIFDLPVKRLVRKRFAFVFRWPTMAHRLELPEIDGVKQAAWSLFITGPRWRDWGFHCKQGWVHEDDFVDPNNRGAVGKGCGD